MTNIEVNLGRELRDVKTTILSLSYAAQQFAEDHEDKHIGELSGALYYLYERVDRLDKIFDEDIENIEKNILFI